MAFNCLNKICKKLYILCYLSLSEGTDNRGYIIFFLIDEDCQQDFLNSY